MPARIHGPSVPYAGTTIDLSANFYDGFSVAEAVDSAAFFLKSPTGTEIELAATLSADRTTATAEYDLPADATGDWHMSVSSGGSFKRNYAESHFEVQTRTFTGATPPDEAYWSRVYFGVGAAGITLPATLMALGHSDLEGVRAWAMTLTPDAQHVYVCFPADWDVAVTSYGLGFAAKPDRTAILTDYDGTSKSYTVRESYYPLGDGTARVYDAEEVV
jgi:hypothetical protein